MIRRAEEKDIPELGRLLVQVNNVHAEGRPDLFRMDRSKYTDEDLKVLLKDPARPVFVLPGAEGTLQGYAFCQMEVFENDHNMTDRKTLYIDDICVDRAARRSHVGSRLYRHVLAYAREKGCYNVTLNVWCENPGAMEFYRAMGLVPYKIGMEEIL